ncbi:MAG: 30S ribosomal protein S6 [Candidatus Omnitrophica bacterium]|nr:30S ribosomal protein S6 [Candidatus Omnitrophota bacterium]
MDKKISYSTLFLIVPEKEESIDELKNTLNTVFIDNGCQIEKETLMGKKKLAYPIKKKTEGIYYEVDFKAEPGAIASLTRQFNINTDLLRVLIDKSE